MKLWGGCVFLIFGCFLSQNRCDALITKHSSSIRNRISGGYEAEPGQFPFQVGIEMSGFVEGEGVISSWCGGSLISDQIVITAAHCLKDSTSATIFLGTTDLSKDELERRTFHVDETSMIINKDYDEDSYANDIALVKLPRKVNMTDYIQTISLPKDYKDEDFEMAFGIISGWGLLGDNMNPPDILQYARRWILLSEDCEKYYEDFDKYTQICVDGSNAIAACSGDSGGPLIVHIGFQRLLVGLTSYGSDEGCQSGLPVVYTRVTAHLDWIAEKSGVRFL